MDAEAAAAFLRSELEKAGCAAFGKWAACHRKGGFSHQEITQFRLTDSPDAVCPVWGLFVLVEADQIPGARAFIVPDPSGTGPCPDASAKRRAKAVESAD